jgi:hypothetical protein
MTTTTSQILIMKTITGRKIWSDGRGSHKIKKDGRHGMPTQSRPLLDSEANRQRRLEQAERQLGKKCVWVDGGETRFISI